MTRIISLVTTALLLSVVPEAPAPDAGQSGPEAGSQVAPKGCPARSKVVEGARCSVDEMRSCDYDAKLSCACMPSQCTTAAGPIPDCKEAWTWVCRKDGCPIIAKQGAC